ncbi:MAG: hypothetical protein GX580_05545 [Candidatus Hydrogenedens sp.]|nr:hypothetical protein [Candidatus Hydrogenedentota bacterium]NLF57082.1 hypothetical protein [Candidatus Hydrogenedens sp.]
MAYGDIGGTVTELVITCRTPDSGPVSIRRGDALVLAGPYTVTNAATAEDPVFGQAMADCNRNGAGIPVRLRGICQFPYTGAAPAVDGLTGVVCAGAGGAVKAPESGAGTGLALKTESAARTVDVLL